jgi:tripartite-type tricarboxylate transporter receptor subunit TctC
MRHRADEDEEDMKRRQLIGTLGLAAIACMPAAVWAQGYPARPVKVVIGFPPGSATDVAARAVAEAMGRRLGQPFVADNKPGAGSNIAAKIASTSPADGYTVFVATSANAINSAFPNSNAADMGKEFLPVTMVGSVPNVLVAHPSVGANSYGDLLRLAKAKPGAITYASSGIGTSPHLSGELFSSMAGVKMVHVPYRGSTPAVTDLLAGQVNVMFSPVSSVLQHIRAGKLKALAVTSAKRTAVAPELPTLDELGLKGFETAVWFGLMVPVGTPADVVAKLRTAAHAALDAPEVQRQFEAQGIDAHKSTPEEFARYMRSETVKWSKVIQSAGIKPE